MRCLCLADAYNPVGRHGFKGATLAGPKNSDGMNKVLRKCRGGLAAGSEIPLTAQGSRM